MGIVCQTSHRAYILTKMDSNISKLCFATFHIILYHAPQRIDSDLQTFFVFPDVDKEMEDKEDGTEMDGDIQDTAKWLPIYTRSMKNTHWKF
jgi:hypothetical protein